jgi:hypothetical protein
MILALSKDKKANVVEKHDEEQLLELEKRIEALEPEIQGL